MHSRFSYGAAILAHRPRWLILLVALVGGFTLGLVTAALLLPAYRPPVKVALPARDGQPSTARVPPSEQTVARIETPQPAAPADSPRPVAPVPVMQPDSFMTIDEPSDEASDVAPDVASDVAALAPATVSPAVMPPPAMEEELPASPPALAMLAPRVPPTIRGAGDVPAWRRNAVPIPDPAGRAMIAIVIDDMGLDQRRSDAAVKLPAPLTLAFLPYGRDLPRQTAVARAYGHELMVHVSMQPQGTGNNPGPNALTTDLTPDEIRRRLDWALAAFDGYVGINNHMGSRFTGYRTGMDVVMAELKARGLLFLDSRTVPRSLGASTAAAHDVPHAARHVFLDNELSAGEVTQQLADTERIARQSGMAIAIGHPHDVTIAALKAWLPTLAAKGFVLVPVSAIVARLEPRRDAVHSNATPSQP